MSDLTLRIGDVCTKIYSGGTPKSTIPSYYEPGVIPWLNSGEVQFKPIYQTEKFISEEGLANSAAKWVYPPAVSVAMYGATAGNAAMVEIPLTTNQAICNLIIDDTKADYRFVYYALKWLNSSLVTLANGAAQQNLNAKTVADFTIPNLPIEKQKKIADVLSTLDKKIELNRRLNDNLEAMAQALYDYWFVQFDFPDENGKPYKSSGGKMVWNEVLKREIPEGWDALPLQSMQSNIITGKTPSTAESSYFGGDIPFITIDDIRGHRFVFRTSRTLTKEGAATQTKKYLPENSLCCSCIGTVGVIGFTGRKSQTNQQINSIVFSDKRYAEFLYFSLSLHFKHADAKMGNVIKNMNKEEFSSISLLHPPMLLIEKFHRATSEAFARIKNAELNTVSLQERRDFLLPLLMNGQVQVKPQGVNYHLSGN